MRTAAAFGLGFLVLLAGTDAAAAQEACVAAPGSRVALFAGLSQPELAGGERTNGGELGVEAGTAVSGFDLSGELSYIRSENGVANPIVLRARLSRPIMELAGIRLCGAALAGGAFLSGDAFSAVSAAGGLALTVGRAFPTGAATLAPYVGVRGLGASTTGDVLGQDVSETGLSVGLEAGLGLLAGRAAGALRVTADGFDAGLGPTPYPALAVRLVAGWRF